MSDSQRMLDDMPGEAVYDDDPPYIIAANGPGEAPMRMPRVPVDNDDAAYCGCCGDEIASLGEDWCDGCLEHVSPSITTPAWTRTFFAQYGRECPYQV